MQSTAAAIVSTITGGMFGTVAGGAATAAGVIQDRGTKTTYYNDYYYYKDGADKNGNIIKANVRYFYTDSSRSAKAYAGHAVSYGPVTD